MSDSDDLDEVLAWREERMVTRNLTLRYDRMMLLLDPTPFARKLAGKKVEVVNYPDGRFAVRHEGVALSFRVFDKIQTVAPGAIVENKRLGAALAFVRELQASYPPNRRRSDPRRQRPLNNLEAPGMPKRAVHRARFWQPLRPSETTPAAGCHFNFAQPVSFQPCADMTSDEIAKAMLQIAQIGCAMSRKSQSSPPSSAAVTSRGFGLAA
jgi:hypothetical protein